MVRTRAGESASGGMMNTKGKIHFLFFSPPQVSVSVTVDLLNVVKKGGE
jgi:hypothetical protein